MALVFSTATQNYIAQIGSWKSNFDNGVIDIYSGAQPSATTADLAPTGNLLCTLSLSAGAKTAEVQALGNITLTGGAAGLWVAQHHSTPR
jgi:hypothetical protein